MKHRAGRYRGAPFVLAGWQLEIIRPLFGTMAKTGLRQYRRCFIAVPKKNGKTALASALAGKLLFADDEYGAEVYSGAASRDQATLVYRELSSMVKQTTALNKLAKCYDSVKRIYVPSTESFYQALSADADYSDGINPSGVIIDELHRHKGRDLYDLLNEGSGTRAQPLTIVITTAGFDRASVCYEEWEYARRVRDGLVEDASFLPVLYELPEDADWTDEANWYDCNPALGDFLDVDDLRRAVQEAQEKPAKEASIRRLRFNQWTSAESKWFGHGEWDACGGIVNDIALEGRECYGGIDFAASRDLAGFVLVFPPKGEDDEWKVLARAWLPKSALDRRDRMRPQLEAWAKQGFLTVVDGDALDYAFIEEQVMRDASRYHIREIGYDPWTAMQSALRLQAEGLTVVPVRQGYKTLSPPSRLLEELVASRRLNHGGNPVLRWCADNVTLETDPTEAIKPSKKKSAEKIDLVIALVTALERAMHREEEVPVEFIAFS